MATNPATPSSQMEPLGTVVATPVRRSLGQILRDSWLALALLLILSIFFAFIFPRESGLEYPGDPASIDPAGTRALVEVMSGRGQDVSVVRETDLRTLTSADTVLLTHPLNELTSKSTSRKLLAAKRVVVAAEHVEFLEVEGNNAHEVYPLDPLISSPSSREYRPTKADLGVSVEVAPACGDVVGQLQRLETSVKLAADFAPGAATCVSADSKRLVAILGGFLPGEDGTATGEKTSGGKSAQDGTATGEKTGGGKSAQDGTATGGKTGLGDRVAEVVVLPGLDIAHNRNIDSGDNAALMMNLLGSTPNLVVVKPENVETPSLFLKLPWGILPPGSRPMAVALLALAGAYIIYRARRFGPLAFERLPVRIDGSETSQALGSLLHASGDTALAAQILQRQARDELAQKLGLGGSVTEDVLTREVARAGGRRIDERTVYRLLFQPFRGSGAELVEWDKQLNELLQEANDDTEL